MLSLTSQQLEAVGAIKSWYRTNRQVFRLFGYAGTGKTTIANVVVDALGIEPSRVQYAAFTGKAAHVLSIKGCYGARTVHNLIYVPQEKARAQLKALEDQLEVTTDKNERTRLEAEIKAEKARLETPDFLLNLDSDLLDSDLLILDEVSMIDAGIARDLESFGVKMLVLGDPAQLPPVQGDGYYMIGQPDYLLTEIHRSALDSPVTRLSITVRNHPDSGSRDMGIVGMDGESGRLEAVSTEELLGFDQILCGTNKTRWKAIRTVRGLMGRPDKPVPGDRIMVIANNRNLNVFNGQQLTITAIKELKKPKDRYKITAVADDGTSRQFRCWKSGFVDYEGERLAKSKAKNDDVAATFANAITVHKAQGSQWRDVLVVDETSAFYGPVYYGNRDRIGTAEAHRLAMSSIAKPWLYTAVTRASNRAIIIPPAGLPE